MKKIINIWLTERFEETKTLGPYATGLVLETEDGEKYAELRSNDAVEPYHKLV